MAIILKIGQLAKVARIAFKTPANNFISASFFPAFSLRLGAKAGKRIEQEWTKEDKAGKSMEEECTKEEKEWTVFTPCFFITDSFTAAYILKSM